MRRRDFLLSLGCTMLPVAVKAGPLLVNARAITPTLPKLRFHSTIFDGAHIWSFGGQGPDSAPLASKYYVDVHKIDLVTGVATNEPYLPFSAAHAETMLCGGYALTIGGMREQGGITVSSKKVQITDLSTGVTTCPTELSTGVHDPCGVPVDATRGVVFGGWSGLYNVKQAAVLNISGGSVSVDPFQIQKERTYATAHLLDNGKVIAIAGMNRPDASTLSNLASFEVIDPDTKTSMVWGELKSPRRYHSSRRIGGHVYVLGGTDTNAMGRPPAIGSIERIDLASGQSERVGHLIEPRYHCHTFAVNIEGRDYIVLCGGQKADGVAVSSIEIFDCLSGRNEIVAMLPSISLDHDRLTSYIGNKAYILSGENLAAAEGTNVLLELEFPAGSVCSRS